MTRHPRKAKEPAAGEPKAKRVKSNAATTSSLVPAFVHTNGQAVVPAPVPGFTTISVGAIQIPSNGGAQRLAKEPTTCGAISGVQSDTATTTGLSFVYENAFASASAPPNDVSMGSTDVLGSSSTAIAGHDSAQAAEKPRRRKAKEPASGEPKAKRIKGDPATTQEGLSGTTAQEASASSGAYSLLFSHHPEVDDEVVTVKKGRPKKEKDPADSTTTVKVPKPKRSKQAKENEAAMVAPKPKGMSSQKVHGTPLWIIITLQLFPLLRRTLRPGN